MCLQRPGLNGMASPWSLTVAKDLPAELRLAQAVSEFQSSLTAKEKLDFNVQKTHYSKNPPTTQDVYKLSAEIDFACGKASGGGGRVFGPRFMNILQAVQRFASIGDVLIGGSQNLLACGVWACVRFTLMVSFRRTTSRKLIVMTGNNSLIYFHEQGLGAFHANRTSSTAI